MDNGRGGGMQRFGIGEPRAVNNCKLGSIYVAEKDELGAGRRSIRGIEESSTLPHGALHDKDHIVEKIYCMVLRT